MPFPAEDPQSTARIAVFLQELQHLGWTVGRNLQLDLRWGAGNVERYRRFSQDLVQSAEVILGSGTPVVTALLQSTRTVPVVFVQVIDPVGGGLVESLARPGGSATGFTQFEYGLSAKWLELLKQIAPAIQRVAVIRDPTVTDGVGQ